MESTEEEDSLAPENLPDDVIARSEKIQNIIDWEKVDRAKIIRLIARNTDIANLVDVWEYNYKIREIIHLLKMIPETFDFFNINTSKISRQEAYMLLRTGRDYFLDKVDIKKYNFSFIETFEIIKEHGYTLKTLKNVDISCLKNYQIADIIANTTESDSDTLFIMFDSSILTVHNWLTILSKKRNLISYCNLDIFKDTDVFNAISLATIMCSDIDLYYLLDDRDFSEVSPFGWEKLLIFNPERYLEKCDFKKLNDNNWAGILSIRPELLNYKVQALNSETSES